jgi:alpha-tubulin suppressor-like RCC1 family protein
MSSPPQGRREESGSPSALFRARHMNALLPADIPPYGDPAQREAALLPILSPEISMKRTLSLVTALFIWTTGCSDHPIEPDIELTPDATSSVVATASGITIDLIEGPTDPEPVNTPVQITAHYTGASGDTHSGVVRWGDGATTVADITEADGAGTATATRPYVLPGVYAVEVEISNQSEESVSGTHEYVTVYNPDGGYVSGNGAILSPPNACTWSGCVADEGAARFGFSSRYHRGAAVPDGNTRFTFRDGNFTFSSTEYDWLVIAGARAQYKGVGTVNREGSYGFMLTATDSDRSGGGEEDRFRIKIWDRDNGDTVVYDNQAGEGDDADLTADGTRLTRGSITVRSTTRNEAPVVIITSPADGATFLETEDILLSADAGDAEDGDMSALIAWSSDLAGELGWGAELSEVSLAPGTHAITAHVKDSGGLEASASVTVEIAEVTVSVSPTAATISEGETQQFTATVYADGVEILSGAPTVAWSSSDENVATVDSDGLATGVGVGEATITGAIGDITADGVLTVQAILVSPEIVVETISAGGSYSCGLTASGNAYCWGQGDYGKLGNGTTGYKVAPEPVAMPAGVSFTSISTGSSHTVALTASGTAYAWGMNVRGHLGNGTTRGSSVPVAVKMPAGVTFAAVSAAGMHTVALTTTGTAYAWGGNPYGQLGDGTREDKLVPTPVALPAGVQFASIVAGMVHTVALTTDGQAYGWGVNYDGRIGDGTDILRTEPAAVAMPTGVSFVSISPGWYHTVALATTGAAYAWGDNSSGQLGNGSTTSSLRPEPVIMPGGVRFASISTYQWTAVALATGGDAYSWGANNTGQLGNGSTVNALTPTAVIMPEGQSSFVAISSGDYHTVALAGTGQAYGWGQNRYGQVGNGTVDWSGPITSPVAVVGGITFTY